MREVQQEPVGDFESFERFIRFFTGFFKRPDPLAHVDCRQSYKDYVPRYYRKTFTESQGLATRHHKWFRRLQPILALPRGSTLLDYGGGYGLDAIFLASVGYTVVFYEITPHHLAICRALRDAYARVAGTLAIRPVLARDGDPGQVDAAYLDEVAHHIEPPSRAFADCARFVRPGGDLFLLEPNFSSPVVQAYFFRVRGFRTVIPQLDERTGAWGPYGNEHIRPLPSWKRIAREAGFEPVAETWLVPFGLKDATRVSSLRRIAETVPVVRHLLATHVTCRFRRLQSIR